MFFNTGGIGMSGIKPRSMKLTFKKTVSSVLDSFERFKRDLNLEHWQRGPVWKKYINAVGATCSTLWFMSRQLAPKEAADIIRDDRVNWRDALPVRVKSGFWCPFPSVLLPGEIVPDDSSRDADVAVDTDYHSNDVELLKILGVVSAPVAEQELSTCHLDQYLESCQSEFQALAQSKVGRKPRRDRIKFRVLPFVPDHWIRWHPCPRRAASATLGTCLTSIRPTQNGLCPMRRRINTGVSPSRRPR